jgi:hypothetical protein
MVLCCYSLYEHINNDEIRFSLPDSGLRTAGKVEVLCSDLATSALGNFKYPDDDNDDDDDKDHFSAESQKNVVGVCKLIIHYFLRASLEIAMDKTPARLRTMCSIILLSTFMLEYRNQ